MKLPHLYASVLLAVALPTAHAGLPAARPDGSSLKISPKPALQGTWVSKGGGVTMLRMISDDALELHGQDSASYWDGRCQRSASDAMQFFCIGIGKEFAAADFSYQSTLTVGLDLMVEQWSIKTISNQEARSGADELVRIKPPAVTR